MNLVSQSQIEVQNAMNVSAEIVGFDSGEGSLASNLQSKIGQRFLRTKQEVKTSQITGRSREPLILPSLFFHHVSVF